MLQRNFRLADVGLTPFKFILVTAALAFLANSVCSTSSISSALRKTNSIDTSYSTTNQQLSSNQIPDSVFQMINLRHLSVQGMDCDYGDRSNCWMIEEIPSEIKNLKNLETLQLNVNAIAEVPAELAELKNLHLVDLSDNPSLSTIDHLVKVQSLEQLFLYGCNLDKLPNDIDKLRNLKYLGLVGNHLNKDEQARISKSLPNCEIKF